MLNPLSNVYILKLKTKQCLFWSRTWQFIDLTQTEIRERSVAKRVKQKRESNCYDDSHFREVNALGRNECSHRSNLSSRFQMWCYRFAETPCQTRLVCFYNQKICLLGEEKTPTQLDLSRNEAVYISFFFLYMLLLFQT